MNVLMIGLDGATFTLLDPMMRAGVMPCLQEMLRRGVRADLMSTRNPLTPPAWTSMITGRSPEAHGIYDFFRPTFTHDGRVFFRINDFRDNHCETIWSIVNRGGKRATSLNFFGMAPAPEIDGYVISGFLPARHLRQGTHPQSLLDEVKALPGFDFRNLGMDIGEEKKSVQGLQEGEHEPWIELQNTRDRAWAELTTHLMRKDRTELTAVVLDGPDKLQHLFWRFVDPAFAVADGDAWHLRIRALCIDFYRRLDDNIRMMVEAAGPETDIVITSDHGFGPTTEILYVNEWLSRQGYLAWSGSAVDDSVGQLTADKMRDHLGMVDWTATIAFTPTPSSNAIYVKKDQGTGLGVTEDEYLPFVLKLQRRAPRYPRPGDRRAGGRRRRPEQAARHELRGTVPGHHAPAARRRFRVDPQIERGLDAASGCRRHAPAGRNFRRLRAKLPARRDDPGDRHSRHRAAHPDAAGSARAERPRRCAARPGARRRPGRRARRRDAERRVACRGARRAERGRAPGADEAAQDSRVHGLTWPVRSGSLVRLRGAAAASRATDGLRRRPANRGYE